MRNALVVLLFLAACRSPEQRLADLHHRLDRVRAAPEGEVIDEGGGDVSFLVGMSRAAIRDGLGLPFDCEPRPDACTDPEWQYGFSRAPRGMHGGGGYELLVRFRGDTCSEAKWYHAK